MTCDDIRQQSLIERYIMDNLEEEQKSKLELHLRECVSCRNEFIREKTLIRGIQEDAHARMKEEIKRRAEEAKRQQSRTDWTLVYKAAAVVFFIVLLPGLIYYQYRIEPPSETALPFATQPGKKAPDIVIPDHEEMEAPAMRTEYTEEERSGQVAPSPEANISDVTPEPARTTESPAAKAGSAARALSPKSSHDLLSGLAGSSSKMDLRLETLQKPVSFRIEYQKRNYEILLLSNSLVAGRNTVLKIDSSDVSRPVITWYAPDSLLLYPIDSVRFSLQDRHTILSRFPDSSRYLLKLAPKPEVIYLQKRERVDASSGTP